MSFLINLLSASFLHDVEGEMLLPKDTAEEISQDHHPASLSGSPSFLKLILLSNQNGLGIASLKKKMCLHSKMHNSRRIPS